MGYFFRILLAFLFAVAGCNLFETRNPQEPGADSPTFIPPTSPHIVIANFTNAIKEKNSENFIACLTDFNSEQQVLYNFIPSADAYARYKSLFESWDINSERRFANAYFSNFEENQAPILLISNSHFDILIPDSAVYVSDYYISSRAKDQVDAIQYSGTMQLTIKPQVTGLWNITRWFDTNIPNDTIADTFSILKARYSN